jgi:hypothetical protein
VTPIAGQALHYNPRAATEFANPSTTCPAFNINAYANSVSTTSTALCQNGNGGTQPVNNLRTYPSQFANLRADALNDWDLSVLKNFNMTESIFFQLRVEAFNANNRPVFSGPEPHAQHREPSVRYPARRTPAAFSNSAPASSSNGCRVGCGCRLRQSLRAAKIGANAGAVHEKRCPGRISLRTDRREDQSNSATGAARPSPRPQDHPRADPEIVEEWKWVKPTSPGTPVFSRGGIVCTGETYKSVVKLTFAKGASLPTPPASSTPASKATSAAPSTSTKAKDRMRPPEGPHPRRRRAQPQGQDKAPPVVRGWPTSDSRLPHGCPTSQNRDVGHPVLTPGCGPPAGYLPAATRAAASVQLLGQRLHA